MNIGDEDEQYTIEPLEHPVPREEPALIPDPEPEREPEKVGMSA